MTDDDRTLLATTYLYLTPEGVMEIDQVSAIGVFRAQGR